MITSKEISFIKVLRSSLYTILWLTFFTGLIAALYHYNIIDIAIPWLPLSIIGTAVAFYVGFKNNQSYDRIWEARKIWGGIVNDSRTWGMMVDGYISNQFSVDPLHHAEISDIKKRLTYRHIAWLYAHRSQLLIPTEWEHITQGGMVAKKANRYRNRFGIGLLDDDITKEELINFLPKSEYKRLINYANTATQIINEQSRDLAELRGRNILDDFRHTQMVGVLQNFYTLQGKNERIKKFPLPRQYANMSRYFVGIFVLLLPFSMIPALMETAALGAWLAIPITVLIGWVYEMMESIGDISENPFQGMANDIPMMSLCRVIEIDLLEMLGETDLPPAIKSKNGVLM